MMPMEPEGDPLVLLTGATGAETRALVALDHRFGSIRSSTTEPLIARMRLLWWSEALAALDDGPAPAVPVLLDLQRDVLPHGVTGAALALWSDAWETLVDPAATEPERIAMLDRRGRDLFEAVARAGDRAGPGVAAAGACWSLADAAPGRGATPAQRTARREAAAIRWREAAAAAWPRAARPFLVGAQAALDDRRGLGAAARTAAFMLTGRIGLAGTR
jgi:phytoene synthase